MVSLHSSWAQAAPFAGLVVEDELSVSREKLLSAYKPYLGNPMDAHLVAEVTQALKTFYAGQGYLVPAPVKVREVEPAGLLVVQMREAVVADVRVAGREHVRDDAFWALVQELKQTRPLSRRVFDEWLARVNRLDLAVQGSLVQASDSHRYLANLNVTERRWHGLIYMDNRAPPQFGRELAQLALGYRFADERAGYLRLDLATALKADRLTYAGLSGTHRLLRRGDTVRWKYSISESALPLSNIAADVEYLRERTELHYRMPVARQTRLRSDVSLELGDYALEQRLEGGPVLRNDTIRAARLGFTLAAASGAGQIHRATFLLERSLDTEFESVGSAAPPDDDFTLLNIEYRYLHSLNARWKAIGEIQAQASQDRLPASERFSIGGGQLGGAFDPATLSGDQGLGVRVSLERLLPQSWLAAPMRAYAYYDHGYVWSNDPVRGADDAGSAGIGVRMTFRNLSASLEAAQPVVKPETHTLLEEDGRVFFTLTQQF